MLFAGQCYGLSMYSLIVTTNLSFSEWSQVIPNPRLCKALIDRLTPEHPCIPTQGRPSPTEAPVEYSPARLPARIVPARAFLRPASGDHRRALKTATRPQFLDRYARVRAYFGVGVSNAVEAKPSHLWRPGARIRNEHRSS